MEGLYGVVLWEGVGPATIRAAGYLQLLQLLLRNSMCLLQRLMLHSKTDEAFLCLQTAVLNLRASHKMIR